MAKKTILTIDEAKTAIINYQKLKINTEEVLRKFAKFQTFLTESYSDDEIINKYFDMFINETHLDVSDIYCIITEHEINVEYIGLPQGKHKIVTVYNECSEPYYIPIEYILDPKKLDEVITKYRKMVENDIKEFKKINLDDVFVEISKELLDNTLTLKDLTQKFKATAKSVYPKWEELNIDVKDVTITKVCDKNIFTVVYVDKFNQYHSFVCEYCGDI